MMISEVFYTAVFEEKIPRFDNNTWFNISEEHLVWRKIAAPADRHVLVCSADYLHPSLLGDSLAERRFLRCGSKPRALQFRNHST